MTTEKKSFWQILDASLPNLTDIYTKIRGTNPVTIESIDKNNEKVKDEPTSQPKKTLLYVGIGVVLVTSFLLFKKLNK